MPALPLAELRQAYETYVGAAEQPTEFLAGEEQWISQRRLRHAGGARILCELMSPHEPRVQRHVVTYHYVPASQLIQVAEDREFSGAEVLLAAHEIGAGLAQSLPRPSVEDASKARFEALVRTWHEETDFLSAPSDVTLNFNYQQIIGMGPPVLPLIFDELKRHGGHWFWALRAITGEDPVPPEARGNVRRMKAAWLEWWGWHR
jgi:hypothetical protein